MFQISWAIAICPVHEFMALDVFFSLGEHETNCLVKSWSSWGLWEPDMLPVANGGQCKGIFRMGRRLFALMKNIKHKYIYMIQYVHLDLANNFALSQGIFNHSRSSWCKADENMKLAGMEASEPREKEWKSTSIQVHFETNLEPCKGYLKVANHKTLSLPCSKLESHGISSISGLGNQRQPDACRGVQTARRFSSVLRHTGYSGTQTTSSFHNVMTKQPNKPTWCEVRWKSNWIRSVSDTSWAVMRKHPIFPERKMLQVMFCPSSQIIYSFCILSSIQVSNHCEPKQLLSFCVGIALIPRFFTPKKTPASRSPQCHSRHCLRRWVHHPQQGG